MIVMYEHRVETISAETFGEARSRALALTDQLIADGWQWTGTKGRPASASVEVRFQRRVQE